MSDPKETGSLSDYVVTMRAVVTRSVRIAAANPEEAVKLVDARRDGIPAVIPRFKVDAVDEDRDGGDGWSVVGGCESCGAFLLDGRDEGFTVDDEEGVTLCTRCYGDGPSEEIDDEPEPVDDPDQTQVIAPPFLVDGLEGGL